MYLALAALGAVQPSPTPAQLRVERPRLWVQPSPAQLSCMLSGRGRRSWGSLARARRSRRHGNPAPGEAQTDLPKMSSMHKQGLLNALHDKYEAQISAAHATINIYLNSSVGIGEHPQHIDELDKQLQIIADAEEKLNILEDFGEGNGST